MKKTILNKCALCSKELKGRQKKYCSREHKNVHYVEKVKIGSRVSFLSKFNVQMNEEVNTERINRKTPNWVKPGKGINFKKKTYKIYRPKIDIQNYRKKRNSSKNGRVDSTNKEMWNLFWDYELPRMMARYKKTQIPGLPKGSFELSTYKICEMMFHTEWFINYRAIKNRLSEGKNCPKNDEIVIT